MEPTMFLAGIWGPVMLAAGLGVFVSRGYYTKIYRNLEQDALSVLLFGMAAMAAGIAQVGVHNVWGSLLEVVVSVLGWVLLIKGVLFVIAPGTVDRSGDWWANKNLIPTAGGVMLVVGAYLTLVAYIV